MHKVFIVLTLAMLTVLRGQSLDGFLEERGRRLWDTTGSVVLKSFPGALGWSAADFTQMRYAAGSARQKLTFAGIPLPEVIFYYNDKPADKLSRKLVSLQVSVYNRGDCGHWDKKRFQEALTAVERRLWELTRDRNPSKSRRFLGQARIEQITWRASGYDVSLRWSGRGDENEYITLLFAERGSTGKLGEEIRASLNRSELRERKIKERDGTIRLEIPPVTQGGKGYCVGATLERVLKYFGSEVDQHIIAQIAESDARLGTSIDVALQALKNAGRKLNVRIQDVYVDDSFASLLGLNNLFKKYNRQARLQGLPEVDSTLRPRGGVIDLSDQLTRLDPSVFIASRQKRDRDAKWFMQEIRNNIDRSYPLCWTLIMFPQDTQQGRFSFHARIINGYNLKNNTIIYTDTWGPESTPKTMPLDEAWAKTTHLILVAPR
ncbi:MAG: hypothetical protein GX574_03950 [Lentisphaerae bacterium]|nr:hypothetical protein [Lentisphaerota bacterium]OQC15401.1 MAG: hypothetical protein BWX73_01341 [Lentisphaerae bacterium ADurb.Bin082]